VRPLPALALLAGVVAAALLAQHVTSLVALTLVLLVVCSRARTQARMYLTGIAFASASLFVITPFVETIGWHSLWAGPTVPVLGQLDVTREELAGAAIVHAASAEAASAAAASDSSSRFIPVLLLPPL
jgi:hypothetical protein